MILTMQDEHWRLLRQQCMQLLFVIRVRRSIWMVHVEGRLGMLHPVRTAIRSWCRSWIEGGDRVHEMSGINERSSVQEPETRKYSVKRFPPGAEEQQPITLNLAVQSLPWLLLRGMKSMPFLALRKSKVATKQGYLLTTSFDNISNKLEAEIILILSCSSTLRHSISTKIHKRTKTHPIIASKRLSCNLGRSYLVPNPRQQCL